MSFVKGKQGARRSKRRTTDVPSPGVPPSTTGPDGDTAPPSLDATIVPAVQKKPRVRTRTKPFWDIGKESKTYDTIMRILALRATGLDDKVIAETLKIAPQTLWNYCYIAGKNGWAETFANAQDQINFAIMPKVVRNLEASLDDTSRNPKTMMPVGTAVALKIAEGTIFQKFQEPRVTENSTLVAIRIEHAADPTIAVREGTIGGVPAYSSDAEVIDVD